MTITEPSNAERARLEQTRGLVSAVRSFAVEDIELRAAQDNSPIREFYGHASVTGRAYEMYGGPDAGGWNETVDKGAFKRTLAANPDVPFKINHEGMSLARTVKAQNLQLREDSTGLEVRAQLDTRISIVNDLALLMDAKVLDEMSFAFRVRKQQWLDTDGGEVPWWDLAGIDRHLQEVDIHKGDVSVVNYGASPHTDAAMRSLIDRLAPDQANELRRLCVIAAMSEKRVGTPFSPATTAVLQSVLDLVTDADDNLDDALEQLSDLMGVPNPDEPEGSDEPPEDEGLSFVHPDLVAAQHRAAKRRAELRASL